MRIKIHGKVTGIPRATVAVAGGEENQARTVNAFVSALDECGIPTMVASLRLTPAEARAIAARLTDEADKAEAAMRAKE